MKLDEFVTINFDIIMHGLNKTMRYTQSGGLTQVTNWVKLKFAAMNLKKLAKWKWKNSHFSLLEWIFAIITTKYPVAA